MKAPVADLETFKKIPPPRSLCTTRMWASENTSDEKQLQIEPVEGSGGQGSAPVPSACRHSHCPWARSCSDNAKAAVGHRSSPPIVLGYIGIVGVGAPHSLF